MSSGDRIELEERVDIYANKPDGTLGGTSLRH
jgi:hypothetical protein